MHVLTPTAAAGLVPQYPTDAADRRNIEFVADAIRQQSIAYLPGEDARFFVLVTSDGVNDPWRRHTWFTSADRPRKHGTSVVVARQNLTDAAVRDFKLARDVAWPDPHLSQFNNPQADRIR